MLVSPLIAAPSFGEGTTFEMSIARALVATMRVDMIMTIVAA